MTRPSVKNTPPALVLSNQAVAAIGFARSLAGYGVDVCFATDSRNEATYSRRFKEHFIIPNLETDPDSLVDLLTRFRKEHPCSVVFPGSDNSCLNLAYARDKLQDSAHRQFHYLIPPTQVVKTLLNKRNFYHSLSKLKIAHPLTYFPQTSDDVARVSQEVDYPVYVKPSLSQVFSSRFHRKGFVARSKEELARYSKLAAKHNIDVLVQEIIPGQDTEIFGINAYFDKNHDPKGLFAYRRIRGWPQRFGMGCLIESIPLSSVPLGKIVVDYLQSLCYHGLADAEFARDPRDGEYKFLEVNPRLWLQNSFPAKCGLNLNLIAYLDALGSRSLPRREYKVGVRWIDWLRDLRTASQMFMDRQMTISKWIGSLRTITDWAYSPAKDFLPWIVNTTHAMLSSVRGVLTHARLD